MSTLSMSDGRQAFRGAHGGSPLKADSCEILRDFGRLEALAPQWDRMWAADPKGEIFQSFKWNRSWWQACGASVRLCTPVVFAGGEVIGILPLILRNGRLEFLGSPHADYGDVICAESSTVEVLEWSLRELQKLSEWREGLLDGLPAESRIVRHAAGLSPNLRGSFQLVESEQCYTILLGDQGAEILDGLARKQHLRRRQNKLEKSGKVAFRHLEDVSEALEHLELFFVCQRRRRAIHGKSSAAENENFRQLLRNLVQDFDLKNDLHFGVLELDAKPLAWHLSFTTQDKLVFYQQTFEVDAWDLAPGEALLRYLLLFAKGRVGRELDFTRGDEPFKARFGNHERAIFQMWLEPRGWRGRVTGARRSVEGALRGKVSKIRAAAKADKGIFERWRSARAWWSERASRVTQGQHATAGELQGASRGGVGRKIWGDEAIVVFTRHAAQATPQKTADAHIVSGGLGALVDFAQGNPAIILPTRVLDLRERFRKGDRAFIQFEQDKPVRVAWVSQRLLGEVMEIPASLGELEPALSFYELWESRDARLKSLNPMLDRLAAEAEVAKLPLSVCCPESAVRLKDAAERQGFHKTLEIHRRRLLGKVLRESVTRG
jgi:CelD/BcsL family acetyltransferase involved in cellulose biosynthesis